MANLLRPRHRHDSSARIGKRAVGRRRNQRDAERRNRSGHPPWLVQPTFQSKRRAPALVLAHTRARSFRFRLQSVSLAASTPGTRASATSYSRSRWDSIGNTPDAIPGREHRTADAGRPAPRNGVSGLIQTLRSWWREPDHYYWMTATVATNGVQAGLCRGIALLTAGLGVLPTAMMFSPAGPDSTAGRQVSMMVTAATILLALACFWRRGRWTTRLQSTVFIVGASSGIAAAALVQSNPVSGFTAAMSFAALSGYCAFAHTTRYACYLLIAAAPVVGVQTARLSSMGDPVWAWTLVTSFVVVNVAITMMCHTFVQLLEIGVLHSDIDPITGLLNRQAFYASVGALVARSRDEDRYLMVAVAGLDNFSVLIASDGVPAGYRVRVAAARTLREIIRREAVVAHIEDTHFLIADSFPSPDVVPLIERVRGAIGTTRPRTTVSVGYTCTAMQSSAEPPSEARLDEVIAALMECVDEVRRSGGNQSLYCDVTPDLTRDHGAP